MKALGLTFFVPLVCLWMAGGTVARAAVSGLSDFSGISRAIKAAAEKKKEEEAAAKKRREDADAAAKEKAAEEARRLAAINEAEKLKAEAQQLLKEVTEEKLKVAATQEELGRAEAALKESQTNHLAEREALQSDKEKLEAEKAELLTTKEELEKDKYKHEVREIAFSTSLVMAVLTILFGIYQHVTSRQNRRLLEQKTQAEIEKIQAETELLREKMAGGPAANAA